MASGGKFIPKGTEHREKYWSELSDPEKIERLRDVIKNLERAIEKMASYLDKLVGHQHLDGRLYKPIEHPNAESYGSIYYQRHKHDEWF